MCIAPDKSIKLQWNVTYSSMYRPEKLDFREGKKKKAQNCVKGKAGKKWIENTNIIKI